MQPVNKTKRRLLRGPIAWLAALLVLVVAAGGLYFWANQSSSTPTTAVVRRGDIRAAVNANARLRADKSARLAFPVSGLVAVVNVKEGDVVRAGDILATLNPDEAERRVRQADLTLDSRRLELARAQLPPPAAELEIAQQNLKKAALALAAAEDRYDEDPTDDNRIARDLAQADYEIARANFERTTRGASALELQALENSVENAELELAAARRALEQTILKAPFDGVITEVNVRPGELLGGFAPAFSLADLGTLELVVEIDEIDIGQVKEGQVAEIRFDALPGTTVSGTLVRLYPAASTDRGATLYRAIVSLEPNDLDLRPGMGATVKIVTDEKKGVLLVPARAIRAAGTQRIVAVRNGTTRRNAVVVTGLSDGNLTEIVSGLNEGDTVIIE